MQALADWQRAHSRAASFGSQEWNRRVQLDVGPQHAVWLPYFRTAVPATRRPCRGRTQQGTTGA